MKPGRSNCYFFFSFMLIALCSLSMLGQGFSSENVTVYNAKDGITLGGTLTLPAKSKPKAVLVLATGSGSQNRDEEIMGHRPFKVIAEYLSENGYAVLRMDDRGVGESHGDPASATIDDYVTDVSCAIAKLDSCFSGSVPKGVLGHSEGGTVAIKIANRNPGCSFIITLGAPAWEGDSIIMSQARAMAVGMMGRWDGEKDQRYFLDLVKSDMPGNLLQSVLYTAVADKVGEAAKMPQVQEQIRRQVGVMCSPGYRAMIKYNPADDIRNVSVPWLALNGDKDCQVLPANLATIAGLNPSAKTVLLSGHNHLFQKCSTGMIQEYAVISHDISDETLSEILRFLDSMRCKSHPFVAK